MKKNVCYLIAILIGSLAVLSSCQKKSGDDEEVVRPTPRDRGNFYVDIDTTEYDGVRNYGLFLNGRLHLFAFSSTGDSAFQFNLSSTALKSHSIDLNSSTQVVFDPDGEFEEDKMETYEFDSKVDPSRAGNITITKFDPVNGLISGTFSVQLRNVRSGQILHLTNGVFTDVPCLDSIPVVGPELFSALYQSGSGRGVASYIRNKYTDEIQIVPTGSANWLNAYRGATVNATGTQYLYIDADGSGALMDLQTKLTVSNFTSSGGLFTPQFLNNKIYGLVSIGFGLAEVTEFDATTGLLGSVIDTVSAAFEFASASTDGINLYYRTSDSLFQVNPVTKKAKGFELPNSNGEYLGLHYLSFNNFYVVHHLVDGDQKDHNYLELWTISGKKISAAVVVELKLSTPTLHLSAYNPERKMFYYSNGLNLEEVNIAAKTSKLDDLPVGIAGMAHK